MSKPSFYSIFRLNNPDDRTITVIATASQDEKFVLQLSGIDNDVNRTPAVPTPHVYQDPGLVLFSDSVPPGFGLRGEQVEIWDKDDGLLFLHFLPPPFFPKNR